MMQEQGYKGVIGIIGGFDKSCHLASSVVKQSSVHDPIRFVKCHF